MTALPKLKKIDKRTSRSPEFAERIIRLMLNNYKRLALELGFAIIYYLDYFARGSGWRGHFEYRSHGQPLRTPAFSPAVHTTMYYIRGRDPPGKLRIEVFLYPGSRKPPASSRMNAPTFDCSKGGFSCREIDG